MSGDGKTWAVVELMGHRKFGAHVAEVERFGIKMLHVEIPGLKGGDPPLVQDINPQAIYCLTACTEEQARAQNSPWSLRQAVPSLGEPKEDDEEEGEQDDDEEDDDEGDPDYTRSEPPHDTQARGEPFGSEYQDDPLTPPNGGDDAAE